MAIGIADVLDAVVSHALTTGWFERVNKHEPKSAPGNGLSASVWVQDVTPIKGSGLAATSGRVEINVRLYTNMLSEPQDDIDGTIITAADQLLSDFSSNFGLSLATIREIDLLGEYGTPLSGRAGYLNQDNKLYRVFTITLPVIVNDIWNQAV